MSNESTGRASRIVATTILLVLIVASLETWWYTFIPPLVSSLIFIVSVLLLVVLHRAALRNTLLGAFVAVQPEHVVAEKHREIVAQLVFRLRHAARRKHAESMSALVLIALAMFGGALLFTHDSLDYFPDNQYLESLQSQVHIDHDNVASAERRIAAAKEKLERLSGKNPDDQTGSILAQSELDTEQSNLEINQSMLATAENMVNEERARQNSEATKWYIAAITWRVGVAIFTFFMVQILIGLYRYASKLEGFYDSRANALSLAHIDDLDSAAKLARLFSPEGIEYGKTPATPLQELLAVIKRAADIEPKLK